MEKRVWVAIAQGGSSTVVSDVKPERNDTRIPAFGYNDDLGHCIAYPFIGDDGIIRRDFVCFSHDDARLIAAAPDLFEALKKVDAWLVGLSYPSEPLGEFPKAEVRAAIAKALPLNTDQPHE